MIEGRSIVCKSTAQDRSDIRCRRWRVEVPPRAAFTSGVRHVGPHLPSLSVGVTMHTRSRGGTRPAGMEQRPDRVWRPSGTLWWRVP